jgi:hypothetical protein
MLFNTSVRAVLMAGLLALVANDLRLVLNDMGMMLARPPRFLLPCSSGSSLWAWMRISTSRAWR